MRSPAHGEEQVQARVHAGDQPAGKQLCALGHTVPGPFHRGSPLFGEPVWEGFNYFRSNTAKSSE